MRFLLYPFSLIIRIITAVRNLLFDLEILSSKSFNIPIICVGNLSIGGSGKTPLINYLTNLLKKKYAVAIISRGYGRRSRCFKYVKETDTAIEVGDEPLLLKNKHPEVIVAVEGNRKKAIVKIMQEFPETDVILLDDGFQHRKIKAGMNILLTSYSLPFFKDHVFPMGKLRESIFSKKRADIFIISKCPDDITNNDKKYIIRNIKPTSNQDVFFSNIKYFDIKNINNINLNIVHKEYNVLLITGISNPSLIIKKIKSQYKKIKHLSYKDHYNYTMSDVREILKEYNKDKSLKKLILTTEKDAVKLIEFKEFFTNINVYVLPIFNSFNKQKEFNNRILDYVEKNKRNN